MRLDDVRAGRFGASCVTRARPRPRTPRPWPPRVAATGPDAPARLGVWEADEDFDTMPSMDAARSLSIPIYAVVVALSRLREGGIRRRLTNSKHALGLVSVSAPQRAGNRARASKRGRLSS